jgi:Trypsin
VLLSARAFAASPDAAGASVGAIIARATSMKKMHPRHVLSADGGTTAARFLLGCVWLLGSQGCSENLEPADETADTIVNPVDPPQFAGNAVFRIVTQTTGALSYCTATLVAADRLLTAAHCVRSGTTYLIGYRAETELTVVRISSSTDIAVLALPDSVARTMQDAGYVPATIHTPLANSISTKETIFTAGYGRDGSGRSETGDKPRWGTMKFVSFVPSGVSQESDGLHTYSNLLAFRGGPSMPNHGDSGGPVFQKRAGSWRLIGVTSGIIPGTTFATDARGLRNWILAP